MDLRFNHLYQLQPETLEKVRLYMEASYYSGIVTTNHSLGFAHGNLFFVVEGIGHEMDGMRTCVSNVAVANPGDVSVTLEHFLKHEGLVFFDKALVTAALAKRLTLDQRVCALLDLLADMRHRKQYIQSGPLTAGTGLLPPKCS